MTEGKPQYSPSEDQIFRDNLQFERNILAALKINIEVAKSRGEIADHAQRLHTLREIYGMEFAGIVDLSLHLSHFEQETEVDEDRMFLSRLHTLYNDPKQPERGKYFRKIDDAIGKVREMSQRLKPPPPGTFR